MKHLMRHKSVLVDLFQAFSAAVWGEVKVLFFLHRTNLLKQHKVFFLPERFEINPQKQHGCRFLCLFKR